MAGEVRQLRWDKRYMFIIWGALKPVIYRYSKLHLFWPCFPTAAEATLILNPFISQAGFFSPDPVSPKIGFINPDPVFPKIGFISPDPVSPKIGFINPDPVSPKIGFFSPDPVSSQDWLL